MRPKERALRANSSRRYEDMARVFDRLCNAFPICFPHPDGTNERLPSAVIWWNRSTFLRDLKSLPNDLHEMGRGFFFFAVSTAVNAGETSENAGDVLGGW